MFSPILMFKYCQSSKVHLIDVIDIHAGFLKYFSYNYLVKYSFLGISYNLYIDEDMLSKQQAPHGKWTNSVQLNSSIQTQVHIQ